MQSTKNPPLFYQGRFIIDQLKNWPCGSNENHGDDGRHVEAGVDVTKLFLRPW
jgi:hypothetical protein